MAFRRKEQGEELARNLTLIIAEQRLGALVEREDAAAPVDRGRRAVRVVRLVLGWTTVAVLVATWAAAFPGTAQRATGPEWYPQVVAAETQCRQDPAGTVRIGALPWGARVPCALVLRGAVPGR